MSRKRANWTAAGESLFDALAGQGLAAGEIARRLSELGEQGASRATVGRRLAERLGARRAGKAGNPDAAKRAPEPVAADLDDEDGPEEPPAPSASDIERLIATGQTEGMTLTEINTWIERVDMAYVAAERDGNTAAIVALARVSASLLDTRRKAAPPPPVDPNAFPDLVEAAERAKALLVTKLHAARARASR